MSGFTGPGFLSAAACGDVFASPSVEQIGSAIDAVLEENEDIDGILLVVMNYTGGTKNLTQKTDSKSDSFDSKTDYSVHIV